MRDVESLKGILGVGRVAAMKKISAQFLLTYLHALRGEGKGGTLTLCYTVWQRNITSGKDGIYEEV